MFCRQLYQVYTPSNDAVKVKGHRYLSTLYRLIFTSSSVTMSIIIASVSAAVGYTNHPGTTGRDGGDEGGGCGGNKVESSDVNRAVLTVGDDEDCDDAMDTRGNVSDGDVSGGDFSGGTASSKGGNEVVKIPISLQSPQPSE